MNGGLKQMISKSLQKFATYQAVSPKDPVNIVEYLKKSEWKSVVGLEVHVQISSQSKLFSGAKFDFTSPVNTSVAFLDVAIPGTLPRLNRRCVEAAILTSLGLNCNLNHESRFHRKHYFYSDLPAGYQITQYDHPIAKDGNLKFNVFTPNIHKTAYEKVCKLRQVQLEQDSGKTIHDDFENRSLVDLNRAGVALMELVFDPDLSDGEEAAALVKELILVLQCLDTSSCRMEEGALRVDANVSVMPRSSTQLGVRSEVKNIGSIRGVANAVNFEIQRQIEVLSNGGRVVNETRAYDATTKTTVPMRDKENIQDYRFMPEPNLLPLRLSQSLISELKDSLPILPEQLRCQLKDKYELNNDFTNRLSRDSQLLTLFYAIMNTSPSRSPKVVAAMLVIHFMAAVNKHKLNLDDTVINPTHLGDLVDCLSLGHVNPAVLPLLLDRVYIENDPRTIEDIIQDEKLKQIVDRETIEPLVEQYVVANKDLVQSYWRKGDKQRSKIQVLMLQSLTDANRKTLHTGMVKEILIELLEKHK